MTGGLAGVVEVVVLAPLSFVACLSSPSPEPSSLRARTGGFINEGMHTYCPQRQPAAATARARYAATARVSIISRPTHRHDMIQFFLSFNLHTSKDQDP